jgi:hypothetical protein
VTKECQRAMERLGQPQDAETSAHLAGCDHCRSVFSAFDALSRAQPPELSPQRIVIAEGELARVAGRPSPPWWREAAMVAVFNALILVAGLWMLGGARLANAAPLPVVWTIGIALAFLAIAGPIISLAPRRRPLRNGLLLALPLVAAAVSFGGSGFDPDGDLVKRGIPCLTVEVLLSAAPIGFALWALTRAAFQPGRMVIGAMSAGAVGLLVLHVHCEIGSVSHLLGFHVLPWLALVVVAVAIRSRLPSRSFAP